MKISTLISLAAVLMSAVPGTFSAEVQLRGAANDECPEGEDMIPGIGCRPEPEGLRPTCKNGRRAIRACYRPNSSWWQCERDCNLGPPDNRPRGNPRPADETTIAKDDCPTGEDMIPGIGCRPEPEGRRPTCKNGRRAIRACYRPNFSWWQCERDCGLGPPNSKQGRRNRREGKPRSINE